MRQLLSACLLLLSITGLSQIFSKKYVDSLTAVALSKKSTHPLILNRDSALQSLWKAAEPADRITMFYNIVAYSDQITPEKSLYYHQLILEGAKKRGDKVLEASVLAELGYINCMNGNTASGLKMIYESLEKAEATGNAQAIGIAYNNLGNCYPNNLQLQREYMSKSLAYSRKGNDYLFTSFDLGNLGSMFLQENKKDSALAYFLKAYQLAVEKNLEPAIPSALLDLVDFDSKENRLAYYRQVILMPFTIRNAGMKNNVTFRFANYYLEKQHMDSAFYYSSEVYNYSKTANLISQLNAIQLMGKYYRALPDTDSTLTYLERYYKLKDSIVGDKVMEQAQNMAYNDMQRQKELTAQKAAFQNRLVLYLVSAAAIFLMGLAFIFWRNKRKEQQAKKLVQQQRDKLEQTLDQLKTTQTQLVQSEKMASLGELTAGIAHEIQNPLNFVNNFSEVNAELIDEMQQEIDKGNWGEVKNISSDIKENEQKINHHGKRADAIVKGMLQHSRSSSGKKELADINALVDEYLRLAYHGLRAKDKSFNATMKTDFDETIGNINIVPQDMGRVILNLITNAFYATNEKTKSGFDNYEPIVTVATKRLGTPPTGGDGGKIEIRVTDNGNGIPQKILDKIFQPFFTTKPTGQGTGLGLSLSYDIVKAHGGELKVETKEGEGSEFIILLPII
jgi:two-component system, NtrC family, sensor kinase